MDRLAAVIGGWQVTGILTLRTGAPLTFTDGGVAINATGNTETPDQIGPINILHGINTGNPWLDMSSFAHARPGTFGTMGRSVWSGPGQFRLDAGISRWINFNERWKMQIRADSYNLTNTPFFSNPNTDSTARVSVSLPARWAAARGVNGFAAAARCSSP